MLTFYTPFSLPPHLLPSFSALSPPSLPPSFPPSPLPPSVPFSLQTPHTQATPHLPSETEEENSLGLEQVKLRLAENQR